MVQAAPSTSQRDARDTAQLTYDGRANRLTVRLPRIDDRGGDADTAIDGRLDEPAWRQAARLTGFSLYQPIDSRPSPDSTDVLIWYSANAIYFGVRAFEPHGGGGGSAVHATLADRDRLTDEDNVEIHLDTFHSRRRAFVFIVNALGVQADGTKSEAGGFIPGSNVMPGQTDLSADFLWASKGHLTPDGFEVEIRIPFKSLRFAASDVQSWGIQVQRNVQHSGYAETWTPARRASASFIAQYGTLADLQGMHHGQVVELNPEVTSTIAGAPAPSSTGGATPWRYRQTATLGGNVTWGMTSHFVLNGTIKPDFSQVEADATQIGGDLRFALFYPERRPFFVEGLDQFNVPNTLVYTRRIVHPTAAAKLTGKVGASDIAFMSAVDDPLVSRSVGQNPIVNILRLRRDLAGQSTAGVLVSDREEGRSFNRVAGGDLRFVFKRLYFAQFQGVASSTGGAMGGGGARTGPMWEAVVDRTGRSFGFHYAFIGIHPDFDSWNGFVPRPGFVQPSIANRFTAYGRPGSLFERFQTFAQSAALWRYDDFFSGKSILEDRLTATNELLLRGGWALNLNPALASFAFDTNRYAGRVVIVPQFIGSDTVAFAPSPRITTFILGSQVKTPQFSRFDASVGANAGNDIDFDETSRARRLDVKASANWRPTEQARVNVSYVSTTLTRRSDDVVTTRIRIPRAKLEYQLSRSIFVRIVGQYSAITGDSLVRDPRTGEPVYRSTSSGGGLAPLTRPAGTDVRVDWLFSYRPAPGTVFFAGYGSSLTEDDPLAFRDLRRVNDAVFIKVSYLLRR
jgi:hypothetical protein